MKKREGEDDFTTALIWIVGVIFVSLWLLTIDFSAYQWGIVAGFFIFWPLLILGLIILFILLMLIFWKRIDHEMFMGY